jgi:hypothetical protein
VSRSANDEDKRLTLRLKAPDKACLKLSRRDSLRVADAKLRKAARALK